MRKIKRMGKACTKACSACSKDRWTLIKVTGRARIGEQWEIGFRCTISSLEGRIKLVWSLNFEEDFFGCTNWCGLLSLKLYCCGYILLGPNFWSCRCSGSGQIIATLTWMDQVHWTPQEADVYFWSSWIHALCSVSDLFACGMSYSLSNPVVVM